MIKKSDSLNQEAKMRVKLDYFREIQSQNKYLKPDDDIEVKDYSYKNESEPQKQKLVRLLKTPNSSDMSSYYNDLFCK